MATAGAESQSLGGSRILAISAQGVGITCTSAPSNLPSPSSRRLKPKLGRKNKPDGRHSIGASSKREGLKTWARKQTFAHSRQLSPRWQETRPWQNSPWTKPWQYVTSSMPASTARLAKSSSRSTRAMESAGVAEEQGKPTSGCTRAMFVTSAAEQASTSRERGRNEDSPARNTHLAQVLVVGRAHTGKERTDNSWVRRTVLGDSRARIRAGVGFDGVKRGKSSSRRASVRTFCDFVIYKTQITRPESCTPCSRECWRRARARGCSQSVRRA